MDHGLLCDLAQSTKVSGERGKHSATCYDKCISHVHGRGPFSADTFFTYIYVDRAQRVNVKHVIFVA